MSKNKVVAYARFSSDGQREESIDAQLRAIRSFCEANDYELIDTYIDEALSATTDKRPSFLRMVEDSNAKSFQFVIVHKLDRFSRDRYDSAVYKARLKKNGVRVLSVLEHLDDSPESVILESLLEGMAEYYSKNLAREVRKGQYENALKAKHNGGTPPTGYSVDEDKNLVINEYEALAVRLIFDMYTQGYSHNVISNALKERGYKTRYGNDYRKPTLLAILKNEKYTGTYVFHHHDETIKVQDAFPAIISKRTFETAKEMLALNQKFSERARRMAKEPYLLSGLLFCCDCGSSMIGEYHYKKKRNKGYHYYKCSGRKSHRTDCKMHSINRDKAEMAVLNWLDRTVSDPALLKTTVNRIKEKAKSQTGSKSETVIALEKELTTTEKQLKNIADAIANGAYNATLIGKLSELENKKDYLAKEIAKQKTQKFYTDFTDAEIRASITELLSIKNKPREEQYLILKSIIKRIDIKKHADNSLTLEICLRASYGGTGT